jgi:hypothetical protein
MEPLSLLSILGMLTVFLVVGLALSLAADKKTEYREGVDIEIPVYQYVKIYAGAFVCVNAAGYAVPGDDASGYIFEGIAREHADNYPAGVSGAITVKVRRRGLFKMTFATAISIANVGDNVFLKTDETVDVTGNVTYNIFCGNIAEYIDTTHAWVDIEPAIRQADVATHIADSSAAHAASAISIADAGAYFAAAIATVEAALQQLAKGPHLIAIPRFTGWTKDGSAHAIVTLPALESPVPIRIKRAYTSVLTAPGSGKTLALTVNGSALASIVETAVVGEAEALDIAIAADTDIVISANETSSGAGANCDIILVVYPDDGE